jgi:hypothetical protein
MMPSICIILISLIHFSLIRRSGRSSNSAKFWLGLQDDFDIEEQMSIKGPLLESIKALNVA